MAQNFPRTRIFELFDLRVGENLTGAFFEAEIISGGIYYKRRIPSATIIGGGGGGDISQNITVVGASTAINAASGNIAYITVATNTELSITSPVANKKYTVVLFQIVAGTRTITFNSSFVGADGTPIDPVVLTSTLAAFEVVILDFLCTAAGTYITLRSRSDVSGSSPTPGLDDILAVDKSTGANDIDLANNQALEFQGTGSSVKFFSGAELKRFAGTILGSPVTPDGIIDIDGVNEVFMGVDATSGVISGVVKNSFFGSEAYFFGSTFAYVFGHKTASAISQLSYAAAAGIAFQAHRSSLVSFVAFLLTELLTANINVQFPNKPAGTYTLAFTSDLPPSTARAMIVHNYVSDETNIVDTNMPLARRFFLNTPRYITLFDLSTYTQCRILVTMDGTAGAAASKLAVEYRAAGFNANVANYVDIGVTEIAATCNAGSTLTTSGWINLAAGAKADNVAVCVTSEGGDGAIDPTFGKVIIQFR